ncbi:auxilin-like clathrin-binding protein required for normal clathrin function [Coniosporium apollinis]|uniref:Auxilin-like clathrin-binding protein required for normal clathrin function n=1 Tax=Coniosporium apollinis TaxID=61459 RepID=A0ABQ9NMW8_9PEZI|nr:auxilin-like clathrin-binding protein required for normal clathrin function [Coniosporium apollinis]
MDDLSGLDWSTSTSNTAQSQTTPSYPALRPTPPLPSLSGRSTPLSAQPSGNAASAFRGIKPPSKPSTPAADSFAGLLSSNAAKVSSNLSMQERQRQLLEEKARQEEERRKKFDSHFGAQDAHWNSLGRGKSTPQPVISPPATSPNNGTGPPGLSRSINKPFAAINAPVQKPFSPSEDEDDILAAFNSAAPVDSSSHFPVPQAAISGRSTPAGIAKSPPPAVQAAHNGGFGDDDDPFGLTQLSHKSAALPAQSSTQNDEDDILGMLGKPVSELPPPKPRVEEPPPAVSESLNGDASATVDPRDKAVAGLVDMGFPVDKSAEALAQTESGTDVQAAVGWLLNQAHQESKSKQQSRGGSRGRQPLDGDEQDQPRTASGRRTREDQSRDNSAVPAWMRADTRSGSEQRRQDSRSPGPEKDVTQYASELGSTLFKSANSLWKTSQKKVQRAVADFQQEGDSSQPKWMRDAQLHASEDLPRRDVSRSGRPHREADTDERSSRRPAQPEREVTDEAMMLEAGSGRPQKPPRPTATRPQDLAPPEPTPRTPSPSMTARPSVQPRFLQQQPQQPQRPLGKLTREDVDQQSSQAYVSPARRKKTTPAPAPAPPSTSLSSPPPPQSRTTSLPHRPTAPLSNRPSRSPAPSAPAPAPTPIARPKPPARQIPPVSPLTLSQCTRHRLAGTEAFKRGDYAAAQSAYTAALAPLPKEHPVTIILLCNRALCHLKTGDPKACVVDAEAALGVIGAGRGEEERISLGGEEGERDMREFYGKALMRKAEALEAMEKWSDAASVWREAVEAGVGGAVAIQGRDRCEKALSPKPIAAAPKPTTAANTKPRPRPTAPTSNGLPAGPPVGAAESAEAVSKLRQQNAAQEAAENERFALTDTVDAKLAAWKGTKSDNLRALLGSLDLVLWPEAGWKKVGMGELVMANKVKIIYMKAIAKVHPDKIPQEATTEQRMISAAVFSTLNEAWDKFKKDNGL